MRDALAATKNFPMLEGNINEFNSLHQILMPISVNVIKDGKFAPAGVIADLSPIKPAEIAGMRVPMAVAASLPAAKDDLVYYLDLAVTGVSFGCMYAMMSVGLTLVYGLLRILHVAHAAVFALGAYITVIVANATGSVGLGFVAAILMTPLFGMAIYRLLYEPLLIIGPMCR